jgi:hypothetical protein
VRLSAPLDSYRLAARYDLLVVEPGQRAAIVDWKTSAKRPERAWLQQRWQTLVYRYVLVEAGTHLNGGQPLSPHQVALVYWFAEFPIQVERFQYSGTEHAAARGALADVIAEIDARDLGVWPLTDDLRHCRYCTYLTLCERERVNDEEEQSEPEPEADPFDFDLDLEQIAEIEF